MGNLNYNLILNTDQIFVQNEMFEPIFYFVKYFIPPERDDFQSVWDNFDYINGLKVVSSKYLELLKLEIDDANFEKIVLKNKKNKDRLQRFGDVKGYAEDLINLIREDYTDQIILTSIPSSKINKKNIVSDIVDYICTNVEDSRFLNGNSLFIKNKDEDSASGSKENDNRSYKKHYDSWERLIIDDKDYLELPIIVLDDVLTTGASFFASHKHLTNIGFKKIIMLAYGKTENRDLYYDQCLSSKNIDSDTAIDGIIFDLDQTIVRTDQFKALELECVASFGNQEGRKNARRQLAREINNVFGPYGLYDGISSLFSLLREQKKIPFTFVTNRDSFTAKVLIEKYFEQIYDIKILLDEAMDDLYLDIITQDYLMRVCTFTLCGRYNNIENFDVLFTYHDAPEFTKESNPNFTYRAIKPRPELVMMAKEQLEKLGCKRIIGIGNMDTDIYAYTNCGLESILVNWGNKAKMNANFGEDWKFDTVEEVMEFLNNHAG